MVLHVQKRSTDITTCIDYVCLHHVVHAGMFCCNLLTFFVGVVFYIHKQRLPGKVHR